MPSPDRSGERARARRSRPSEANGGDRAASRGSRAIGRGSSESDVLLAEDRRLERARLAGRLEPELLVEAHAEVAVAVESLVLRPSA